MPQSTLDCVQIGYYQASFEETFAMAEQSSQHSGFWHVLKQNSVLTGNRRLTYMELLNRVLKQATGKDPNLNVARLPNLASCYLYSFLTRRGFHVEVVNSINHDEARLIELLESKPRAVAISTTFYVDPKPIADTVAFIRRWNEETTIIVGGPFVAKLCKMNDPSGQDFLFKSMGADIYVNEPQGESTLARILAELRSADPNLATIGNLIHRSGDKWNRTAPQAENNNLDENSIDWSLFDPSYLGPTVQTRTSRSCSFRCSFCNYPEMAGALSLSGLDTIEREMQRLRDKGVRQLVFIDDTFNVPLPRFKSICRMMIKNRFDFRWFSYFRCANSDLEAFDLMAESGCTGVFLGVESGDDSVLGTMDKFSSVKKLSAGIGELNKRDIVTFGSFIVGFPGETDATVENTIRFIEDTNPRFYRAELWYADPLTPIWKRRDELGIRGGGYSWKHHTMDWKQAAQWSTTIYDRIRESAVLPVYDFDFWCIPYLMGQGISVDQLKQFASGATRLLVRSSENRPFDSRPAEAELVEIFAKEPSVRALVNAN